MADNKTDDGLAGQRTIIDRIYDSALSPEQGMALLDELFTMAGTISGMEAVAPHVRRVQHVYEALEQAEANARGWLEQMGCR